MIDTETARVDHPRTGVAGALTSDQIGWRSLDSSGRPDNRPARPVFDSAAWRWFQLVDVAVVDGAALIKFRWREPGTPDLSYLTFAPLSRASTPEAAAFAVRAHLRSLLAPQDPLPAARDSAELGWRHRAHRVWLEPGVVLVSESYKRRTQKQMDVGWQLER